MKYIEPQQIEGFHDLFYFELLHINPIKANLSFLSVRDTAAASSEYVYSC